MATADNPSDADFAREIIAATLGRVRTAIPAKVLAYDSAKQTITAQIAIRSWHVDVDTNAIVFDQAPPIPNVPVLFLGAGAGGVTAPLAKGDPVTLIIAERSTDEWRSTGKDDNSPRDPRRFDLTDALAIPGGRPLSSPLPAEAVHATDLVVYGDAGVRLGGSSASDFVALASRVEARLTELKDAINGWTPVPSDGGAALKTALATLFTTWPASVASAKVRSL